MFSISSSSCCWVLFAVPCRERVSTRPSSLAHQGWPGWGSQLRTLKARCSRKCAVPFVSFVSALEPASIQTPTVEVWAQGEYSEATWASPMSVRGQLGGGRRWTHRQTIFQGGGLSLADGVVGDGRGQSSPKAGVDGRAAAQTLREVQGKSPGRHGGYLICVRKGGGDGRGRAKGEWFDGFLFLWRFLG